MGAALTVVTSLVGTCVGSCASYCACEACKACTKGMALVSRWAYCFLFMLSLVLAWILRDHAEPLMKKIPWIDHDGASSDWFGKQAVYRISFGNFAFFFMFAILLVGVKFKGEVRGKIHTGGWMLKLALWLSFNIIPFFFPNEVFDVYSWFSRFGSGIFLIMQMVILLDFTHMWNDSWVSKESVWWLAGLLTVTVASYGMCIGGLVIMYKFFNPSDANCSTNLTLISMTLIVATFFSILSLLPQVQRGSLFPSSIIALYTVFLCFSALSSQPYTYECNGLGDKLQNGNMAIGMIITLVSVVYSAVRVGSSSSTFSLDATPARSSFDTPLVDAPTHQTIDKSGTSDAETGKLEENHDEMEPVDYNYSFFHCIFALASMYVAMLMTSWASSKVQEETDSIDVGWTSVWVKMASQWIMSGLYIWTLLAPIVLRDRDFTV